MQVGEGVLDLASFQTASSCLHIQRFWLRCPPPLPALCGPLCWQVGEGVQGLAPGDAVALEPGVPCWHCSAAREGRYNLDPNIHFFATPPVHGSLATSVDHPAELCYKLPQGVRLEEGAMCEPLSVGIHACR